MVNALELKHVSKRYPGFLLKDVSFALPAGYIMGFIGENGAGKSTTIKLILDVVKRDAGQITVLGKDNLTGLLDVKADIGVVMDECCFPETLTLKNIDSVMWRMYPNWNQGTFWSLAKKYALPDKKQVKDFSRGMKMKLSIAVALSHNAKLLILDEATSGLDPIVRDEILDEFLEFIQDESHAILLSSHITSDLEKVCDYITYIHQGEIVFSQPADQLQEQFSLLKCSKEAFLKLDKNCVKGYKANRFGVEALVERKKFTGGYSVEKPTLEDIMRLFR